jgi:hypothetical protein
MKDTAPILLFAYRRLDTLRQTVASLQQNSLAPESLLFIFSDQGRTETEKAQVEQVRAYLKTITGFKKIQIFESDSNKGLANSIISGTTRIINEYGRVIVLEDDLLLTPNFLSFMNTALDKYVNNPEVYSISGFMFDISHTTNYSYDVFFTRRHCSWGWAMWKDRWNEIDWEVTDFAEFNKSVSLKREFDRIGSDLSSSLIRQMEGKINSWAIRCNYHQFKKQTYTVYPLKSKVVNIGFGNEATHTHQRFNKYKATPDTDGKYEFALPDRIFEEKGLLTKFTRKYSLGTRIRYFILNKIFQ